MIRTVDTKIITENVKEMCIEANHYLSKDMDIAMKNAVTTEKSELGRKILNQLQDNLKIADEEMIPICQDTGMACVFLEIGQDVHIAGGDLAEAVNEGVRRGYDKGYLRKSVVKDPVSVQFQRFAFQLGFGTLGVVMLRQVFQKLLV